MSSPEISGGGLAHVRARVLGQILCEVLAQEDTQVQLSDWDDELVDELVDAAVHLMHVSHALEPGRPRWWFAWRRTIVALERLSGGAAGGPLLALIYGEMTSPAGMRRGPVSLCLALAILQALPLLSDDADVELARAAIGLVGLLEQRHADPFDLAVAAESLSYTLERTEGTGGDSPLRDLVLEWLACRSC